MRVLLVAALSFWLLYLLVANVLVGTGILRNAINESDPDDLHVRWSSAYSIVPGWVVVDDFALRFQDKNVQFFLALDHASIRVDLLALAKKELHVTRVRAEGAASRFRMKVLDPASIEARLAAFPPIEGFEDPPKKIPEPDEDVKKPTPPSDELWTIHIEDVEATVRELWFVEARFVGNAAVRGAFRLQPMRELDVWPAELSIQDGTLSAGGAPVLELGSSQLFTTVHHFDVRVPEGLEVLRFVDARLRLRGKVASITPFAALYTAGDGPRVGGGVGEIDADLGLDRGRLVPGSTLRMSLAEGQVATDDAEVRGPLALGAHVDDAPHLELTATTRDAMVGSAGNVAAKIGQASLRTKLAVGDVVAPPGGTLLVAGDVAVRDARTPDLAALQRLAPKGVVLRGGVASLALEASMKDDKSLSGRADLALSAARIRFDDLEVSTSGKLWTNFASEDGTRAVALPSSGVALDDLAVQTKDARVAGMRVTVTTKGATTIRLPSGAFSSALSVRASPGARVLEAIAATTSVPRWLARAAAGPEASAELRITKSPAKLEVVVDDAKNGIVRAQGFLRSGGAPGRRGAFLVEAADLHAGVALPPQGSAEIVPFANDGWLDARRRALP